MEKYQHNQTFKIKYCDVDFKDELKPSVALALMEEVACSSADELGFGYAFVKPRGYAFMVTSISLEFIEPIRLGEEITVRTWPNPPSYVVFGREYQMLSSSGKPYVNASSRWCLIDVKTQKILQSKLVEGQDYSTYNTDKALENVQWKIPTFKKEDGALKYSLTVANSEYDHNFHVNNTRYADYCFNCFSVEELRAWKLKQFTLSYVRQCKENERLDYYVKQGETGGEYFIQGFNQKDETVTQARVLFEK